jgi:hypothetical protein
MRLGGNMGQPGPVGTNHRPPDDRTGHHRAGHQRGGLPGRGHRRRLTAGHWVAIGVVAFMVLSVIVYLADPHAGESPRARTAGAVTAMPTTAGPVPSTVPTHLAPASVRNHAAMILRTAVDHYARTFARGQAIVGTTQYPNATAGLAALENPNSAASRFAAWRKSTGIERDVSTYMNAFHKADAGFNASDEPASISQWMQDTGTLQADISHWIYVVVSYQISEASQADLDAAAATVRADVKTARHDVALVRQGQ